jgi:hypothetical protein
MASDSVRFAVCLLLGLVAGGTLGIVFAPDPTGVVAFGAAVVCAGVVTGTLYRSDWLRA